MDTRYGSKPDEVDEFFKTKRSWSNVKDRIVGDYIECYLKTVQHLQRPILIVDGFAGPGRFGDGTDGSPLIICNAISKRQQGRATMSCLFSDTRPAHRAALKHILEPYIRSGLAEPPHEECSQALTRALELGAGSTLFFYLDPYGIKDLEFEMVRQIYQRDERRSTEILINFNFRTFMRMSGNWNYGDSPNEVSRKVKQGKTETVNSVMGGNYWHSIITDPNLNKIEREDAVVRAYVARIKEFFTYVYAIPVKERSDNEHDIPDDELARYHLIFATRSARAVLYMNDVALNALEPYFIQFKEGLLFDFTPERYRSVNLDLAKNAIVEAVRPKPIRRPEIYDVVVPQYFMHRRKKEYRAMIDELSFKDRRLYPDSRTLRRPTQLNDETLLSAVPWAYSV
jgi:three-Cys-motif partner protein